MRAVKDLAICILVHSLETEILYGQHIWFLRNLSIGMVNSEQGPLYPSPGLQPTLKQRNDGF